ncbi:MAG: 23S rRNA (adenine(2503)-C(2))-methyltransferase RlmN [Nitrospirae bacterium]|nr:23S rRNA (adenine(2503)-C(2))-methyltransferase RlmN [Nitrospirota bacterium]
MVNLKALSEDELNAFLLSFGLPPFRTKQLLHWIYEKRAIRIHDITVLSKPLREMLSKTAYIGNLKLLDRSISVDGTEKYLFGLDDGETIETVLIPDGGRTTICVSSQVGCTMSCRFCLTGRTGFVRDLSAYEIVDQVIAVQRLIEPRVVTNVVFMGMGEPLNNLDSVTEALRRMNSLLKISKRRITVSTSGVVPGIERLSASSPAVNLAVSLNATTDDLRTSLMPVNRRYPIGRLLDACRRYPLEPRRRITFEYVLFDGLNDSADDADRLAGLLRGIPSKVNLIPFNPIKEIELGRPPERVVAAFRDLLQARGITAVVRKSKGRDILAACGQLRGRYADTVETTAC